MKKIPVKTLYLLLVISIGLIGLGIGSTYAIFTASSEINSPIILNSNLSYTGDVIETIEVEVPSMKMVTTTLNVTNSSGTNLNYVLWYLDEGNNIMIRTTDSTTASLEDGDSVSITTQIYNNSNNDATVILGILSSSDSVVLGSNMKYITGTEFSISDELNYDNSNTGVECSDVTCMLDYLYDISS